MNLTKFLVVRTVDGEVRYNVVEADDARAAMNLDSHEGFKGAINGEPDERSNEIRNHDVATIGIYEVGAINHLDEIMHSHRLSAQHQDVLDKLR